ncbi:MAG: polysaccharide lyase family 7 protein, partial [Eubacteriales bacterium]|nr:polysaccharide lyase family 7 protein [Eubacteriales bacterium]
PTVIQAPVIEENQLTQINAVSNSCMYEELKKNYKVQLPVFKEGSTASIKEVGKSSEIAFENYYDKWFYYDPEDKGLVFYTLVKGKKTANTTYTRTELREMMGDKSSDNWGWTGTHRMTTEECVTMIPQNGKVMVSQVHAIYPNGDNGPVPLKVIYEGNEKRLAVSFLRSCDSNANQYYYFNDVELGQRFKTTIEFIAGSAYVTIESEGRTETYGYDLLKEDSDWAAYLNYFKAGNYIQDSSDPREGAGSVVRMYSLDTYHDNDNANNKYYPVETISIEQETVRLGEGERTRLTPVFEPVKATNKELVWTVAGSGSDIVSVDQQGNIVAKKKGCAAVLAYSKENPAKAAKCVVTVGDTIKKDAVLIYEQDFGTESSPVSLQALKASGIEISDDTLKLLSVVNGGNPHLRFNDTDETVQTKIGYRFNPVSGPVTVSMKVKVDSNTIKGADTAKPSMSYSYFYTYGVDSTQDIPAVLGCIRNRGKRSGDSVIDNSWGLTKGYIAAPLNVSKTSYNYGEWVELTMITTPSDGSANSNTTTYYINGYKAGSQLGNFDEKKFVSQIEFMVGTKDMMDLSVDDIKIYDGIKAPQSDNAARPESISMEKLPEVMMVGDSCLIAAKAKPDDAYEGLVYAVVSGDSVTVSKDGFIIASKAGDSVVRISSSLYPDVYIEQKIQVFDETQYIPVTGIKLEDDKGNMLDGQVKIKVDETFKLVANV